MITVEPIEIPFFGTINKVNPVIKNYELTGDEPAIVLLELYENERLVTTVEQPVSRDVYGEYSAFFDAFKARIVDWTLVQKNIRRAV